MFDKTAGSGRRPYASSASCAACFIAALLPAGQKKYYRRQVFAAPHYAIRARGMFTVIACVRVIALPIPALGHRNAVFYAAAHNGDALSVLFGNASHS